MWQVVGLGCEMLVLSGACKRPHHVSRSGVPVKRRARILEGGGSRQAIKQIDDEECVENELMYWQEVDR